MERRDEVPNLITKFRAVIPRLCQEHQIPLAAHAKVLAEHGALLSYGPDNVAVAQDLAGYIDKILKGAKPADLPVQQAARLELVINMKTAKALGLTVPPSLLLRADQVIE